MTNWEAKVTEAEVREALENIANYTTVYGFEMPWGEVSHSLNFSTSDIFEWGYQNAIMNYPTQTTKKAMKEQVRTVLEKMVNNGELQRVQGIAKLSNRESVNYEIV